MGHIVGLLSYSNRVPEIRQIGSGELEASMEPTTSSVRQFITSLVGNLAGAASPFPLTGIQNSESLNPAPRVPIPNSPYRLSVSSALI